MDRAVKKRIQEWTAAPFDIKTVKEISDILSKNDEKELIDRFYTTLEFGTGGLRGVIGAGTNRMNIYTVGMATQGLANYIKLKKKEENGVVIARDSRRMSDEFSREAAGILAGNGIKVYYFDDIAPTPLCSFAIRHFKAGAGIVVTASHNPPEYNGYKVYWDDGGQVVPPFDREIIAEVNKIDSISKIKKMEFEKGTGSGMIRIIRDEADREYISSLEKAVLRVSKGSDIKIVYTPLHGSGYKIVPEVLKHFGFNNIFMVEDQSKPDGNFPTVKYPNPEEKEALTLSIELAKRVDADILLATDPDADRMGVGFKGPDGDYQLINGNQIGTMLEYYLLSRLAQENRLPKNAAVIKTIVTTQIQDEIAKSFNCSADNVVTGFKWIAMKMKEYDDTGSKKFIFGGEESYGYLPVDFVRDKDAVSSCYFFAEMADYLLENKKTLNEFLNGIYARFGLYMEDLLSLTLKGKDGMEKISSIMKKFRTSPPQEFAGIAINTVADIQGLTKTDIKTGKKEQINGLPKSDVLQFFLEDRSKITMRPSGTEPKIKFYFSVNEKAAAGDMDKIKLQLKEKIERFKKDLSDKVSGV